MLKGKKFESVYYEERNRHLNKRLVYEFRCDDRLKAETEGLQKDVFVYY
jgi:hypothetical protein